MIKTPLDNDLQTHLASLAKSAAELSDALVRGKRRENTWLIFKRTSIVAVAIAVALFYVVFYGKQLGYQSDPISDAVAVVPIRGPIGPGLDASADNVVPIINRACASPRVHTVLLEINSGGGVPSESERIIEAIEACKAGKIGDSERKVPVVAVVDGVGASAAYMIAIHADEIIAGRYSLVGSIGAIVRYNDISAFVNEHGIIERAYRSAPLKGGASMFAAPSSDESTEVQSMVDRMAGVFFREVSESRGDRLKIEDDELFSGRVWTAEEGLKMGLVDGIGTIETLQYSRFKELKLHRYRTKPTMLESMGLAQAIRQAVAEAQSPRFQ